MKKIILTLIAAVAFIGLFATNTDGSLPVYWTAGCIAALYLALRGLSKILDREEIRNKFENGDEVLHLIDDLGLERTDASD